MELISFQSLATSNKEPGMCDVELQPRMHMVLLLSGPFSASLFFYLFNVRRINGGGVLCNVVWMSFHQPISLRSAQTSTQKQTGTQTD